MAMARSFLVARKSCRDRFRQANNAGTHALITPLNSPRHFWSHGLDARFSV
jgi:hypothetical protein